VADFNTPIVDEFRSNKGKVGNMFSGMDLLLLHTTGAKSGKSYVNPLAYTMDGDNFVIAASKGGADTNPDWYSNLTASPETTIEVGEEKIKVRATEAIGAERDRLYGQHADKYPGFKDYETKTTRVIPVFLLARV
jgi:deazaflavin-dependent oxidoreductase (nitroreductase family)